MRAPMRVRIQIDCCWFHCQLCGRCGWIEGFPDGLAAAADAGRAHLAEHHTPAQGYCRLHGVHRGVCGCRVASVDPGALGGRENAAQAIHVAHNGSRADA